MNKSQFKQGDRVVVVCDSWQDGYTFNVAATGIGGSNTSFPGEQFVIEEQQNEKDQLVFWSRECVLESVYNSRVYKALNDE